MSRETETKLTAADSLVQAFLKNAKEHGGFNALVVYGIQEDGKAKLRLASNHNDPKIAAGVWSWLTRIDAATVEACARALHDREDGCYVCTALEAVQLTEPIHSWITDKKRPWTALDTSDQARHVEAVVIVTETAKLLAGRPLNITPA